MATDLGLLTADGVASAIGLPPLSSIGIPALEAAKLFATSDIIIRDEDEHSRVATHEYGHFALCSLMHKDSLRLFSNVNADIIQRTTANRRDRADDVLAINEGFADYISAQVAGGIDYYRTSSGTGTLSKGMFYCDTASQSCVEDNIGGTPGTEQATPVDWNLPDEEDRYHFLDLLSFKSAIVTSYMMDVVDGDYTVGDLPSEGAAFTPDEDHPEILVPYRQGGTDKGDELIALGRGWLTEVVHELGNHRIARGTGWRLNNPEFFKTLNDILFEHYSRRKVCDLCELHLDNQFCDRAGWSTFACETFEVRAKVFGLGKVTASNPGRVSPVPMDCSASAGTCTVSYDKSTLVQLKATPSTNQRFVGWSGACSGPATTCTVQMTEARSVQARFEGIPVMAKLTVIARAEAASFGTITSSPSGINCVLTAPGSRTCTMNLQVGTVIRLTGTHSGADFLDWDSVCANSSNTAFRCEFEITRDTTVTGKFWRLL